FERKLGVPDPSGILAPDSPTMPSGAASALPEISDVFPGWNADCMKGCPDGEAHKCAAFVDLAFHAPLERALAGKLPNKTDPLADIAETCRTELGYRIPTDTVACAAIPELACAVGQIQTEALGADADYAFGTLFAHTLDPALFVA